MLYSPQSRRKRRAMLFMSAVERTANIKVNPAQMPNSPYVY
ncbi:hypothetical protein D1BOALGB6SA_8094 [Olavius sp. associated proteobacterium Delta 1]|nr:hypothetical protein D1BOALGB6SA_8094 [Olavius sp. associated proteobacterium Delta 1]